MLTTIALATYAVSQTTAMVLVFRKVSRRYPSY